VYPPDPAAARASVPYEEVPLTDATGLEAQVGVLAQPPPARLQPEATKITSGSRNQNPLMPGDPMRAGDTPSSRAAADAASGRWLADLLDGRFGAFPPGIGLDAPLWGNTVDDVDYARASESDRGDSEAARDDVTGANLFDGVWVNAGLSLDAEDEEDGDDGLDFLEGEAADGEAAEGGAGEAPGGCEEGDESEGPGGAGPAARPRPAGAAAEGVPAGDDDELWGLLEGEGGAGAGAAPRGRGGKSLEWAVLQHQEFDVGKEFDRIRPDLAVHYPFELDRFQKDAVCLLERGESVFVAAHTSAGKTVVAEYAFALATRHKTRAVYTSPIKTISNQKFRDFSKKFDVGLLTGDVSIKPESPCLIMTTEILRSMLYKGADVVREIEWVVFDEVHYVNDADRGVVWEEVIIMLPPHIGIVMLSATVPNVAEFADWVGRTKRKRMFVTGTTKRPVPLEHHLYHDGKMFKICEQSRFYREGLLALKAFQKGNRDGGGGGGSGGGAGRGAGQGGRGVQAQGGRGGQQGGRGGGGRGAGGKSAPGVQRAMQQGRGGRGSGYNSGGRGGGGMQKNALVKMVRTLETLKMTPTVVFCFSKKRIDEYASQLRMIDFTSAAEKSQIHVFCEKALDRLKGSDRRLPQILRVRELLGRGIGVHHAGLLPIVKEVVEMLFCRGLISLLLCTETFAMGVNAPAKTVVFQQVKKHDGTQLRMLLPGEYTQMAGRAGRRGLDTTGTVLLGIWDDPPAEKDLKTLTVGRATLLQSRFRLTYLMICSLLRVEDLKVEDMMKRSFAEFHAQRAAGESAQVLRRAEAALSRLRGREWPGAGGEDDRELFRRYCSLGLKIARLSREVQEVVMDTPQAVRGMTPGRVVVYASPESGLEEVAAVLGDAAGPAAAGAGRAWYLLTLRRPPPEGYNRVGEVAAPGPERAPAAGDGPRLVEEDRARDVEDLFGGLQIRVGKGKGKKGAKAGGAKQPAAAREVDPGPLPRLGEAAGREYAVVRAPAADIRMLCQDEVVLEAGEVLRPGGDTVAVAQAVQQLARVQSGCEARGGRGWPGPYAKMREMTLDLETGRRLKELEEAVAERAELGLEADPLLSTKVAAMTGELVLETKVRRLQDQMSDANLRQLPEFQARLRVLQHYGYVSGERTVELKGRVMCEMQGGDELLGTEIVFRGLLSDLEPEECVAALSALIFQERVDEEPGPGLPETLRGARSRIEEVALELALAQADHGVDLGGDAEEWVRGVLKWGLVEVVYEWARGMSFDEICKLTSVMEGSIVRTIMRLDEQCRMVRNAARIMGNTALFEKLERASQLIKRDVIFAASLYIQ